MKNIENIEGIESLGIGLDTGSNHYRAYVGPAEDYDLVSAMVFNLMTSCGLRQHHKVLDVGCGSLRVGRLLIPYLNARNYYAIEPNKWLIEDGVQHELGRDQINIKEPLLVIGDEIDEIDEIDRIDYTIAQSIFSHCGIELIDHWIESIVNKMSDNGVLLATFLVDEVDYDGNGWVYPDCVSYRTSSIEAIARKRGLNFQMLDWAHPRQQWFAMYKDGFNNSFITQGQVSWNKCLSKQGLSG